MRRKVLIPVLATLLLWSIADALALLPQQEGLWKVPLRRNDNYVQSINFGITFEQGVVSDTLKNRPVRLPSDLPSTTQIGLTTDGIYVVFEKRPNQNVARLIIDRNRNDDLRDDTPIEVKPGEPQQVTILRRYTAMKEKEVWLPYEIRYTVEKKPGGVRKERFSIASHYRMEGQLELNGQKYFIGLLDINCDGKFDQRDLRRGSCVQIDLNQDGRVWGAEEYYFGFELIPIGEAFYEVRDVAEDGGVITFIRSKLRPAEIGKKAPDFPLTAINGQRFRLKDMKGETVLLDFWASWCRPCVAKFPELKQLYQEYRSPSFVIISISIDRESHISEAKKIVEKYQLPWVQVIEGKGQYSPIWQVYGGIGGNRMAIPLYVIIDPSGLIQYAGRGGKNLADVKSVLNRLMETK